MLRADTAHKAALRRVANAESDAIQARSRLRMALAIDGGDAALGALDETTEIGLPVLGAESLDCPRAHAGRGEAGRDECAHRGTRVPEAEGRVPSRW